MNKDRVEGKVKDVAGRAERQVGEWTGNSEAQVKGAGTRTLSQHPIVIRVINSN